MSILSILYVGELWEGGTSLLRLNTLREEGININSIDSTPITNNIVDRLKSKIGYPTDTCNVNSEIIMFVKVNRPNILWIDKGITINRKWITQIRD